MLHLNLGRVLVRILTPLNVGKCVEKREETSIILIYVRFALEFV